MLQLYKGRCINIKKRIIIKSMTIILLSILLTQTYSSVLAKSYNYGVFIGLSPRNISKLTKYKEVVIDAYYFSKEQIDYLHEKGVKVYSYLNIGSIEEFRPYYNDFKSMALGNYENWNDEQWIDVSNIEWQKHIVHTLAKDLDHKGIDGFFIDNVDIYSMYKNKKTFNGLYNILNSINNTYNKAIIINGGYDFITTAISNNIDIYSFLYGVNLEEVYTHIENYEHNVFTQKSTKTIDFTIEYLKFLKSKDLNIYVIEYSKNKRLNRELMKIYNELNFKAYISRKINL